jgi:uncharacterized protein
VILVDTGPIVAAALTRDVHHRACVDLFTAAHLVGDPLLEPDDWRRAAELVTRYADMPLGAVDASVVAVAERLGLAEIATIDRRHFSVVRPRHIDAFTLLPH